MLVKRVIHLVVHVEKLMGPNSEVPRVMLMSSLEHGYRRLRGVEGGRWRLW